jgi:hypothetical protein
MKKNSVSVADVLKRCVPLPTSATGEVLNVKEIYQKYAQSSKFQNNTGTGGGGEGDFLAPISAAFQSQAPANSFLPDHEFVDCTPKDFFVTTQHELLHEGHIEQIQGQESRLDHGIATDLMEKDHGLAFHLKRSLQKSTPDFYPEPSYAQLYWLKKHSFTLNGSEKWPSKVERTYCLNHLGLIRGTPIPAVWNWNQNDDIVIFSGVFCSLSCLITYVNSRNLDADILTNTVRFITQVIPGIDISRNLPAPRTEMFKPIGPLDPNTWSANECNANGIGYFTCDHPSIMSAPLYSQLCQFNDRLVDINRRRVESGLERLLPISTGSSQINPRHVNVEKNPEGWQDFLDSDLEDTQQTTGYDDDATMELFGMDSSISSAAPPSSATGDHDAALASKISSNTTAVVADHSVSRHNDKKTQRREMMEEFGFDEDELVGQRSNEEEEDPTPSTATHQHVTDQCHATIVRSDDKHVVRSLNNVENKTLGAELPALYSVKKKKVRLSKEDSKNARALPAEPVASSLQNDVTLFEKMPAVKNANDILPDQRAKKAKRSRDEMEGTTRNEKDAMDQDKAAARTRSDQPVIDGQTGLATEACDDVRPTKKVCVHERDGAPSTNSNTLTPDPSSDPKAETHSQKTRRKDEKKKAKHTGDESEAAAEASPATSVEPLQKSKKAARDKTNESESESPAKGNPKEQKNQDEKKKKNKDKKKEHGDEQKKAKEHKVVGLKDKPLKPSSTGTTTTTTTIAPAAVQRGEEKEKPAVTTAALDVVGKKIPKLLRELNSSSSKMDRMATQALPPRRPRAVQN